LSVISFNIKIIPPSEFISQIKMGKKYIISAFFTHFFEKYNFLVFFIF